MISKKKHIVIAEIGVNHNGKINLAKKLILKAKQAGADFAKFQIFKANKLASKNAKMADYQMKNVKKINTQFKLLKNLELKYKDLVLLKKFCNSKKINFLLSVFDEQSFDFAVNKLKEKIIKIPSGEINNISLLRKINLNKVKVILSTGMSNLQEIVDAINIIAKSKIYLIRNKKLQIINNKKLNQIKKKIVVMHCVTDYPVDYKYANLNAILTLKKELKLNIGYSDHTKGILAPIISKQLGSVMLEKHFTLNKNDEGPDHKASLDFEEFRLMCESLKHLNLVLGDGKKVPQICELKNSKIARKSIVAIKKINIGDKFSLENLGVKRPGNGINPNQIFRLIGKKSKKAYKFDDLITI